MSPKRSLAHRVDQAWKQRLIDCLLVYSQRIVAIYLGGSQASTSEKLPHKASDVDVYVFLGGSYSEFANVDPRAEQLLSRLLGRKIALTFVNALVLSAVSQGMELLWTST